MYLVLVKNPADFIGSVLGESEKNTKGILAATVGKVLVIDEVMCLRLTTPLHLLTEISLPGVFSLWWRRVKWGPTRRSVQDGRY